MSQAICRGGSTIEATSTYEVYFSVVKREYISFSQRNMRGGKSSFRMRGCEKVFVFPLTTDERRKKMAHRSATLGDEGPSQGRPRLDFLLVLIEHAGPRFRRLQFLGRDEAHLHRVHWAAYHLLPSVFQIGTVPDVLGGLHLVGDRLISFQKFAGRRRVCLILENMLSTYSEICQLEKKW